MRKPLQVARNAWRLAEKTEDAETQQDWLNVAQTAALVSIAESLACMAGIPEGDA